MQEESPLDFATPLSGQPSLQVLCAWCLAEYQRAHPDFEFTPLLTTVTHSICKGHEAMLLAQIDERRARAL